MGKGLYMDEVKRHAAALGGYYANVSSCRDRVKLMHSMSVTWPLRQ